MGRPIASALVVGDGVAGWLAAASLSLSVPDLAVTVVDFEPRRRGVLDLYAGTRPEFKRLLTELRLDERSLLAHCDGVFRLGQCLAGWRSDEPEIWSCFGLTGARMGAAPFHLAWLRHAGTSDASTFFDHSGAVALARTGRFAHPDDAARAPVLDSFDYGFGLEAEALRALLRNLALARGVQVVGSGALETVLDDARISCLRAADGLRLSADLYVDATGPGAQIFSQLPGGRQRASWRPWLAIDRVSASFGPATPALPSADRVVAEPCGWLLSAPLRSRNLHLRCWASSFEDPASACETGGATEPVVIDQGRRQRSWIGNCVAVGEAAVELEPLGAWPLHLLTEQLRLVVDQLPDSDFAAVELAEYERKAGRLADTVGEFVMLHHALANRKEPFWVAGREHPLPPMLARTVKMFAERGKVPTRDSEEMDLEDWLAVLIGFGVRPRLADPFTDELSGAQFWAASARLRARIEAAVARSSDHRQFLNALLPVRVQ